jgi:hypothetical protein
MVVKQPDGMIGIIRDVRKWASRRRTQEEM